MEKVYSIKINGIKESINAIESLKKQLDALDAKIVELENRKININGEVKVVEDVVNRTRETANATSNATNSTLKEDVALQKELNALKNEGTKLEAKQLAYQDESYQKVLAQKDVLKEIVDDQKAIAAQERLQANMYSNTLSGMKQHLADLKSVINTTDLGDGDAIKKMTQDANELAQKLKEMEEAYGQFGRNVGNYQSAFDGVTDSTKKFTIEVGAVTREFGNAREASKTLKNELYALENSGKRNTTQAKNLRNAIYNLQSTMKDATVTSKAMDNAMDWMQSFASMNLVGKGLGSYFGFEKGEITKNIQDLVALQGVLNGIESIRKQMETREGVGKLLGKGFEKIDTWTFGLKRMIEATNGVTTATKRWEAAINVLNYALKGIASLGIYALMEGINYVIGLTISSVKDWVKGNADLVDSEKVLNKEIEVINFNLQERLNLNKALEKAGRINQVEREIEDEKAYADAIAATNKELEKRVKIDSQNKTFAQGMQNANNEQGINNFLQNDKGVTTIGGFSEAAGDMEELIKRYEALSRAVERNSELFYKNSKTMQTVWMSASDARDELNHLEQFIGGNLVGAMTKFDLATEKGRQGLEQFVNGILKSNNTLYKSILLRLPEIVSDNEGKFGTALQKYVDLIRQFAQQADQAMKQFKFEEMVEGILDSADETGQRIAKKRREELRSRWMTLSSEQKVQEFKSYKQAMDALDKMQKKRMAKISAGNRTVTKKEVDWETELNRLRIERMKDGLQKQIVQLEEEKRQRLAKIQKDGVEVETLTLETEKLYDQKIKDAKEAHYKEMEKLEHDMWRVILDEQVDGQSRALDNYQKYIEEEKKISEDMQKDIFNRGNSSYGIPDKKQLSFGVQQNLGIVSTLETKDDEKQRDLMLEKQYNAEMAALEKQRTQITEEEYEKRKQIISDNLHYSKQITVEVVDDAKKLIDLARQRDIALNERDELLASSEVEIKIYEDNISKLEEAYKKKTDVVTKEDIETAKRELEIYKKQFEDEKAIRDQRLISIVDAYEIEEARLEQKYSDFESNAIFHYTQLRLQDEGYTESMEAQFKDRITAVGVYWKERISEETEYAVSAATDEKKLVEKKYEQERDAAETSYKEQDEKLKQYYEKRLSDIRFYADQEQWSQEKLEQEIAKVETEKTTKVEELAEAHKLKMKEIETSLQNQQIAIDRKTLEEQRALYTDYFGDVLNEFAKFQNAVSKLESRQLVKNEWGFTNWKQTNKNNKELLKSYETMLNQLVAKRAELNKKYSQGLIDKTVYSTTLAEFDELISNLGMKIDETSQKLSLNYQIETIIQESQQYLSYAMDTFTTILSAVWDAEDRAFEKEQEKLDEWNDKLQDALDKQQEIVQEHKDAINDIEDELSTARGDRRAELIDRLNAEVAAEKRAAKEKEKLEKEQEKLKIRQEELDKKRQEAEYNRQIIQAIVNGAMAVTMAAVNKWPVPAIPMMALAAATTAAQVAIMKQNKPYAKGGLLEGKSHAEGGIPVGNTGIEVEGKEYVIRKKSTAPNLDVLDYINKSERKLKLDDFINFYSSKTSNVRRVVASASPKSRFADGGTIPMLNDNYEFDDRLLNAFERYADRPYYVTVTDIENGMDDVKYIRTLAGIE